MFLNAKELKKTIEAILIDNLKIDSSTKSKFVLERAHIIDGKSTQRHFNLIANKNCFNLD